MTRKEGAGLRTARKVWTMDDIRLNCIEEGECLLWQGRTDSYGYPRAYMSGRNQLLRPYIWREIRGNELRVGYRLSTRCGNRLCLADGCLVTRSYKAVAEKYAEKARTDPVLVERFREGARNAGRSKLSQEIANEMRASGLSDAQAAQKWGVNVSTARRIRKCQIWAPRVANSVFNLAATMGVGQ